MDSNHGALIELKYLRIMSLQLGNRGTRDDLYTILVNLIGAVPILLLIAIYTPTPTRTFIYSIAIIIFLPTAIYDVVKKSEYSFYMIFSLAISAIPTIGIIVLVFVYNPIAYALSVYFSLLTSFLLHPVENSQERISDVKSRYGTQGYQNAIILKNTKFHSDILAPIDLGIIGRDSFFKYLISDYYTFKQAAQPIVFFTVALSTLVQIFVQQFPDISFVLQFSSALLSTFILGISLRILASLNYTPKDLLKEIRERLDLNFKKSQIQKLRKPTAITAIVGIFLSLFTFQIPLPTSVQPSGRFVNLLQPSTDFLLPLSLFPVVLGIYIITVVWRNFVWSTIKPIEKNKKQLKNK